MADEETNDDEAPAVVPPGSETEQPDVVAASSALADAAADADDERRFERITRNSLTGGTLFIEYPARTVVLPCDGDTALRIMTLFSRTSRQVALDQIDEVSDAGRGWVALDTESPLAIAWTPSTPSNVRRTTIDPYVQAA